MEQKARQVVLGAVEQRWRGPPFNPIKLADIMGIPVRPNAALADARVFWAKGGYEIEYNPHRPRGRVNFSIGHVIAHTFFLDCAERVRNRSREKFDEPDWQLEVLCNIGAAELTMPVGSFHLKDAVRTIEEVMRLRKKFDVSAEAMLVEMGAEPSTPASPIGSVGRMRCHRDHVERNGDVGAQRPGSACGSCSTATLAWY